jgi:hypothetical protein
MHRDTTRRRALHALAVAGLATVAPATAAARTDDQQDDPAAEDDPDDGNDHDGGDEADDGDEADTGDEDDESDAPGNSGEHRQDDDARGDGDPGNSGDHRQDDDRGSDGDDGEDGDDNDERDDDEDDGDDESDDGDGDDGEEGDDDSDDGEEPSVSVSRSDDGLAFTGGQTNRVDLEVTASTDVLIRERVPASWSVVGGDPHTETTSGSDRFVEFTTRVEQGTRTYLAEAPDDPTATGVYEFGPVAYSVDGETWTELDGTTQTVVLGQST